jgi:transcriptional regulator with XRE-family HTH domain
MKTKSFQKLLEKRLSKEEIAEIEMQALLEVKLLRYIQKSISDAMADYMKKNDVGFNELVRRLDSSPAHVAKIQKGEANLTVSSMAHILALLGKEPKDVFKSRK